MRKMAVATFENLKFESTKTKVLEKKTGSRYSFIGPYRMIPAITADEFKFTFRGTSECNTCKICAGLIDKDHKLEASGGQIGNTHGNGWALWVGHGQTQYPGKFKTSTLSKTHKDTDTFGFKVSKTKKTMEFFLNGVSQGISHENCNFPKEVYITLSFCSKSRYELLEYSSNEFTISKKELVNETNERLEFINEKCSDFQIPLANKTLNLWKSFLYLSNINNIDSLTEYDRLKDYSLDIDEMTILQLILGYNKSEIRTDQLFDYFQFFKLLGMKNIMFEVIKRIEIDPNLNNFKSTFELFVQIARDHENEDIKSWFSSSPRKLDDVMFQNSFCLSLFNHLKKFESEYTITSPLVFLPYSSIVAYHVKKQIEQEILQQSDFLNTIFSKTQTKQLLSKLYTRLNDKSTTNLDLVTCDQHHRFVHREIVIWKSNFFYKMFSFGGRETEEMEKSSSVQLEDLGIKEIELLVQLYYLEDEIRLNTVDLETIVLCCIHCHKYFEEENLYMLLNVIFPKKIENSSLISIKKCLDCVGYLLEINDEMKELILTCIEKNCDGKITREKMNTLCKESGKKEREDLLGKVVKENEGLRERVTVLEDIVKDLNERIQKLEKKE